MSSIQRVKESRALPGFFYLGHGVSYNPVGEGDHE